MKTNNKARIESLKAQCKALYAARQAAYALEPKQLSLHSELRRKGQAEPAYVPGMDCPGYNAEVK